MPTGVVSNPLPPLPVPASVYDVKYQMHPLMAAIVSLLFAFMCNCVVEFVVQGGQLWTQVVLVLALTVAFYMMVGAMRQNALDTCLAQQLNEWLPQADGPGRAQDIRNYTGDLEVRQLNRNAIHLTGERRYVLAQIRAGLAQPLTVQDIHIRMQTAAAADVSRIFCAKVYEHNVRFADWRERHPDY